MDIGERIFQHRKRLGLSQEELAARLGVSRQAVSKWELGTSTPEPENIIALARIFGITTDEPTHANHDDGRPDHRRCFCRRRHCPCRSPFSETQKIIL